MKEENRYLKCFFCNFYSLCVTFEVTASYIIPHVVFYSLTKDMTGKEDVYRGPAIRALCRITDVNTALFCLSTFCIPISSFTLSFNAHKDNITCVI